jgi:pyruvate dehydrogenase E2 component (dihydrolipoamide acetyltransferase)
MSDFTMPSLGADMESGTVLEWLVKPGDVVERGDLMAVVDTDKAAVEIETFESGVVGEVLVHPGERVDVGATLATLLPEEKSVPAPAGPRRATAARRKSTSPTAHRKAPARGAPRTRAEHAAPLTEPVEPVEPVSRRGPTTPAPAPTGPPATPPVRHHATELGVDLGSVTGSGPGGRITREDIDAAVRRPRVSPYARRLAADLGVDLAQVTGRGAGGSVRAEDVRAAAEAGPEQAPQPQPDAGATRTSRATIAALMSRSKREIPHYYVATTIDMAPTVDWLRKSNRERPVSERIVPAAVLLRAIALAARRMPELNGFWVDDAFVPGQDVNVGVAISVRNGALVAPALHGAADLGVPEVMHRLRDVVSRARSGRLTRAELTDPTLTVTDLGDQGVEEVFGVITPPQVALIGVGRMVERPWAVDGLLGIRPLVHLSLSGDHRATDGYTGARVLATIDDLLQHPEAL